MGHGKCYAACRAISHYPAIGTKTFAPNKRLLKAMKTLNPKTVKARAERALESARKDLSANILVRRATLQLSQVDLAERSGVSRPVISKLETAIGDFQISALAKVAAVLDCPVAELLAPGFIGPVTDAQITERFKTPRTEFVKGADLWAALEEVSESRKATARAVDRRVSSGGRKGSASLVVYGRKKSKN